MKRICFLFFLMIGLIQWSFSQSEFIKRGKSGVEVGAGFSANSEANGKTLYAGYSFKGFLDLSLTYWKKSSGKIQDGVFTPTITFYPVKQEDAKKAPTLGLSVGYSHYKSVSVSQLDVPTPNIQHQTDTLESKMTVDAIKIGVSASHRSGYWKMFFFQPMIGVGASIIKSGWEYTIRGGVAIGSRIKRGPLLVFTPSVERQSGVTTFVFSFGVVF
jgi:hypothetical protein